MITIISSTNRSRSKSYKIAKYYEERLKELAPGEVHFLDLADITLQEYENLLYSEAHISDVLAAIQDRYIIPADKFLFVVPEYNGGMPGILKLFIDAMSVREIEKSFSMKKACLTGVSSGRAGNLRGMDHLTGVLNYLQVVVFPNRLPISRIESFISGDSLILDDETQKAIDCQLKDFISF